MSAPPSGKPNGVPRSQKANPLRPMRKQHRANPLVSSRKPMPKPSLAKPASQNGPKPTTEELRRMYGGWSEPPPPGHTDIPIMTTKKALMNGIRYHMMRFSQAKMADKPIDPLDQDEFARPVTLHRRDARQPPPGRAPKVEVPEQPQVDEQEVERLAQVKAEREAQRAIDQAKIAPVAKDVNPKRPKKQKEEKTNFNRAPKTASAKKESDIRYEEALPWHLEDADGKNVWVGSYVAALSETNVAFMIDRAVFRMVPLEKWYRFTSKPPFQPFTIDEAENLMNKKMDPGRWIMRDDEKRAGLQDLEATRRMLYGHGQMIKTESSTFRGSSRLEKQDHDEIDMSGDEFQDDDEAPLFERNDDEDTKEAKDRIRREQLGANLFGDGDEQEVDRELKEELREELERQRYGKATKKALIKRDREDIYASDSSDSNPWSSSDDGSSSDEDEEDKDEKKDEDDKKDAAKDADAKDKEKAKGSKGTSSSQGKGKSDGSKKAKSLKRSGSPTLSESSGNESMRKKLKKTATPATGSRAGTPLPQSTVRRPKVGGAGSGSDGEATAGEMSDGAGQKKKKLKVISNSARGTPSASRAGSPIPNQGGASPGPSGSVIEGWEILEQIPPGGISISDLIKPFQGRVGDKPGQMPKGDWIKLVKQICQYGPDKLLRRKQ